MIYEEYIVATYEAIQHVLVYGPGISAGFTFKVFVTVHLSFWVMRATY